MTKFPRRDRINKRFSISVKRRKNATAEKGSYLHSAGARMFLSAWLPVALYQFANAFRPKTLSKETQIIASYSILNWWGPKCTCTAKNYGHPLQAWQPRIIFWLVPTMKCRLLIGLLNNRTIKEKKDQSKYVIDPNKHACFLSIFLPQKIVKTALFFFSFIANVALLLFVNLVGNFLSYGWYFWFKLILQGNHCLKRFCMNYWRV